MYFDRKITTANSQIGILRASERHQESGIKEGCFAADHCRSKMQFYLAADRNLGEFYSADRFIELTLNSQQECTPVRILLKTR